MSIQNVSFRHVSLLALAGILLFLSASAVESAEPPAPIPVYYFSNCSNATIHIQVTPLYKMYEQAYTLVNCSLQNKSEQLWECFCADTLNVTLQSFQTPVRVYMYAIVAVAYGNESLLLSEPAQTEDSFTSKHSPSPASLPSSLPSLASDQSSGSLLTGAVVGASSTQVFTRWAILLIIVIALSLLLNVRFIDWPWQEKRVRARRLHKHAKKIYAQGEHKQAEKYYARAARLRK